ncbi:MAG: adenosylcobinamide-GDP ribazoletransferase [Salinirussus sp.]
MALRALRGAVGFLTRLPVGHDERAWAALRARPYAFVVTGYCVGAVAGAPLALPVPGPTAALAYLIGLVGLTGINHADGLADVGDAAAVHGGPERRRAVMTDTTAGVGAAVAVGLGLVGLALGGLALSRAPWRVAVGLAVAAEVSAKAAMVVLAAAGTPSHDGLGAQFTGATTRDLLVALVLATPAAALAWPTAAAVPAVVAGPLIAAGVLAWANRQLGGVSGDVFGATNELGRIAALHVGVVAWTLS